MPTLSLSNVAFVFLAYVAYRIVSGVITKSRFKAFAKQHGCEDPLDVTGPFPYGWWTLRRISYVCYATSTGLTSHFHEEVANGL